MIDGNEDFYLKKIQQMLVDKTYSIKPSDYKMFRKIDKGKEREIFKLNYFPHRIIQHALMNIIQPIIFNTLTSDTYSSIPNRGIHKALANVDKSLKSDVEGTRYCLKLDIKKFYPSINQSICKSLFRRKFKDPEVLWLIDTIIDSMDGERGIAIGSLFSQWAGNYYLTYFDHWLKEDCGVKHYFRYCDDIVVLHGDKDFLHTLRADIDRYLTLNLDLTVKGNWQVFPTRTRGIDFVGYRHFGEYVLLRKSTATTLKRKLRKIRRRKNLGIPITYSQSCTVNSYLGWLKWCNGHNLKTKYTEGLTE